MLTSVQLQGIFVPVITPFQPSGELDLDSYRTYISEVLQHGVHGVIVGGTTGESSSLTWSEIEDLFRTTKEIMTELRVMLPVIIGTGTNDTASTLRRTELARNLGADAVLVVVPYYNRPAPSGIIEHFRRTNELGIPVIAYNVPYRTGVELSLDTLKQILELPNVIGLKDSSGGIQQLIGLVDHTEKSILCGEDLYLYAALCAGARGGIVASSCVSTASIVQVYEACRAGRHTEARLEFDKLVPMIELLFREPNPAPLKWMIALKGWIQSSALRLPMTEISESLQSAIRQSIV